MYVMMLCCRGYDITLSYAARKTLLHLPHVDNQKANWGMSINTLCA